MLLQTVKLAKRYGASLACMLPTENKRLQDHHPLLEHGHHVLHVSEPKAPQTAHEQQVLGF
jgi:hypothetical protein